MFYKERPSKFKELSTLDKLERSGRQVNVGQAI